MCIHVHVDVLLVNMVNVLLGFIDGPADCSTMSVIPQCQATIAEDESTADFLITVSTNGTLMCVEGYQIQFNGENKSVSLESPTANFVINVSDGQPLLNEIIVYTLDFENRTGNVLCNFNVLGEFPYMNQYTCTCTCISGY